MARVSLVAFVWTIITIAGCGGSADVNDGAGKQDQGADFDIEIGGARMKVSSAGIELPEDFPKDVAVYPGATVVQSLVMPSGNKQGIQVTLKTDATVEKLSEFYEAEFKKHGWTVTYNAKSAGTMMLNGKKDEDRFLHVSILQEEKGETMIMLMAGTQ